MAAAAVALGYMPVAPVVVAVPIVARSRHVAAVPADYSDCEHKLVEHSAYQC